MAGRRMSRGFTLIELLVVVAVIALLVSILLPSLNRARESGRRAVCQANLHHIGLAFKQYFHDNGDMLPLAAHMPLYMTAEPNEAGYYAPIMDYLRPYTKNADLFRCPADVPGKCERDPEYANESYFKSQGTSYDFIPYVYLIELAKLFLPNVEIGVNMGDVNVKWRLVGWDLNWLLALAPPDLRERIRAWIEPPTSDVYLLRDCDTFHGFVGTSRDRDDFKTSVRHTLYADCHVEDRFRLPWGADPNQFKEMTLPH
jgi:prepilin-type N-terminal cleavage/methylation domain-containing protein